MKIAINGAGVAGPALAYWLLRSGHEVVLIEKAPEFRAGGYVVDFWGVGYTVAERMGILPAVKAAGYQVQELRLVDDRGRRVGGFDAGVFRGMANERFTSVPRGELAKAIYGAIEGRVETLFSNSIAALEEGESGVRVGFDHGPPREFDLVVGADGLHSIVRELAFGSESRFERRLGYRVAAVEVEGYQPRDELVYVAHARPGRQIARFALRGDRTMFLFVFVDDVLEAEPHDVSGRKAVLHRVFGDDSWECPRILKALDQVEDVYFDQVSQIQMDAWSHGRVVLIGDAAACVSLLAGEGTGLAMAEAYVLAGELNRAPAGDHRTALRRYEERLRTFVEGKQESARRFANTFTPKTRFGILIRNLATRLMASPPIARFLSAGVVRDDFDLPDYEM